MVVSGGGLGQMVWVYHVWRPQAEGYFKGEEKREKANLVSGLRGLR